MAAFIATPVHAALPATSTRSPALSSLCRRRCATADAALPSARSSSFCSSPAPFSLSSSWPRSASPRPLFKSSSSSSSSSSPSALRMQQSSPPPPEEEETVSLSELQSRLSDGGQTANQTSAPTKSPEEQEEEDGRTEKQKEIERLRAAEKFIEIDEGRFECTGCGYVYEPQRGDAKSNIKAGTPFDDIPSSYTCPQCRTPKRRFVPIKKVIAGFADNQSYGFGSNTMTGGQKSLLIFGGLGLCFLLLLSGYAMN